MIRRASPIARRRRYLGLVPRRYQSGEVDYVGGISKCGDRRVRTLLYEAANVMLTRYKGQLKLKDWAFAIAKRSTMRKARVALARRLAIIMHAMLRDGTEFELGLSPASHETGGRIQSDKGYYTLTHSLGENRLRFGLIWIRLRHDSRRFPFAPAARGLDRASA